MNLKNISILALTALCFICIIQCSKRTTKILNFDLSYDETVKEDDLLKNGRYSEIVFSNNMPISFSQYDNGEIISKGIFGSAGEIAEFEYILDDRNDSVKYSYKYLPSKKLDKIIIESDSVKLGRIEFSYNLNGILEKKTSYKKDDDSSDLETALTVNYKVENNFIIAEHIDNIRKEVIEYTLAKSVKPKIYYDNSCMERLFSDIMKDKEIVSTKKRSKNVQ
ncbi:MAG TPA: hypothetical protein PLM72_00725 [Spirochaetota bacterium]|nr:hypothetical protein [Spirochaetota bacterium]